MGGSGPRAWREIAQASLTAAFARHAAAGQVVITEQPFEECYEKDRLVYLTADTDEELAELRDDEVYVIGGLVDRNRHKDLTARKARALGVRCARLPLAKHADLSTPLVLTVNHGACVRYVCLLYLCV